MAQTPGDLPSREQLELFVQSGQGATEPELDMVKKSDKKAAKKAAPPAKSKSKKGPVVANDETNSGDTEAGEEAMAAAEPAAEAGGGGKGRGKGKGKSGGGGGGGGGGAIR